MKYRESMKALIRFGDIIIDLREVVALVGDKLYLLNGMEIVIGDDARTALLETFPTADDALKAQADHYGIPSRE